jgi:hypothetical protein
MRYKPITKAKALFNDVSFRNVLLMIKAIEK